MYVSNKPTDPIADSIKTAASPKTTQLRSDVLHIVAQDCVNDDDHDVLLMTFEHISPRVALMNPGEKRKAKYLFDPEFWEPLSDPERRYFGKLVVRLVALGLVPLTNLGASPRTGNHVVYQRV